MVCNISKEDVIDVAVSLNITLTEDQINQVLNLYNFEEECDPTASWDLVVEHCIHQINY